MLILKNFLCKPLKPTLPTLYNYTRTRFCALLIEDDYEFRLSIYVTNVIPRQQLRGVGGEGAGTLESLFWLLVGVTISVTVCALDPWLIVKQWVQVKRFVCWNSQEHSTEHYRVLFEGTLQTTGEY